jgi:hypothetical protein
LLVLSDETSGSLCGNLASAAAIAALATLDRGISLGRLDLLARGSEEARRGGMDRAVGDQHDHQAEPTCQSQATARHAAICSEITLGRCGSNGKHQPQEPLLASAHSALSHEGP